ncbi:glyoxalase [Candidatus Saccharibacteria bacterium RIFCSPHIGHO2_01_FULL_45_15]|nr:MAG: glyoxalase [Candidatus Saccharibacteria bacterium RIFCSPHIGHO2_01_FULL_45_15]OGL26983.1 MAG: glyoxalase [Candidatus Saccharibacteria bacterium RIFCSPHIGHO2_02_FULL_46_12]OGL32914.1 MAG: glyoxalase [Candidatus Saccharibacteria bacterium RIFCSPHIGHO2_12_FULL_44_22]
MQMKLELIPVPVSDTDIAIDFYVNKVGFILDHDIQVQPGMRFVQLTPPGSACSILIGDGMTEMKPGSQQGLQMVIDNATEAYTELKTKGVDVSDVEVLEWGSFVYFSDPDGNSWALQEMPHRNK